MKICLSSSSARELCSMVVPGLLALSLLSPLTGCSWFPGMGEDKKKPAANAQAAAGEAKNAKGQPIYVVKADFTPLYRLGPQQPGGADDSIPKGTLVGLIKRSSGFSRVQLESGLDGYVSTDDIAPAPPEALPQISEPGTNLSNNSAVLEHYSVGQGQKSADTSANNAQALPELPEPSLEPDPTPVNKPDFRY